MLSFNKEVRILNNTTQPNAVLIMLSGGGRTSIALYYTVLTFFEQNNKFGPAEFISASYESESKTAKLARFRNKFGMTENPRKEVLCA